MAIITLVGQKRALKNNKNIWDTLTHILDIHTDTHMEQRDTHMGHTYTYMGHTDTHAHNFQFQAMVCLPIIAKVFLTFPPYSAKGVRTSA